VARQRIAVLRQERAGLLADLDGDADIPVERHSAYLAAEAARERAALDLQHTVVHAPFDGVASRKPDLGDYVSAGTAAMSVVADQGVWIEANFKKTELTHVRPGQQAVIEVDPYPDRAWHGVVESISQATGAQFALLPPQNATGNWVKVVQRIPVRITIPRQEGDPALRAGMSVTAEVDTRHRRELPGVLESALTWTGYLRGAEARAEPAR
jgi:membrane fusion protein, multidrug efflux system